VFAELLPGNALIKYITMFFGKIPFLGHAVLSPWAGRWWEMILSTCYDSDGSGSAAVSRKSSYLKIPEVEDWEIVLIEVKICFSIRWLKFPPCIWEVHGLNTKWRLTLITQILHWISSIHTEDKSLLSVLMYPKDKDKACTSLMNRNRKYYFTSW
jgi:hypothetical protein